MGLSTVKYYLIRGRFVPTIFGPRQKIDPRTFGPGIY